MRVRAIRYAVLLLAVLTCPVMADVSGVDADSGVDISLIYASANGLEDYVRSLISNGARTDTQDTNGLTALMAASRSGHQNIVKMLLERRADVTLRTKEGATALMMAAKEGCTGPASLLIDAGSDVNARDVNYVTPLMWSAVGGCPQTALSLIKRGAEVEAKSRTGLTALDCALIAGNQEVVIVLVDTILCDLGITYSGGDGRTVAEAIVVSGANDEDSCVKAECLWVMKNRPGWRIRDRIGLGGEENGYYDQLVCGNPDSCRTLYFQVNETFRMESRPPD